MPDSLSLVGVDVESESESATALIASVRYERLQLPVLAQAAESGIAICRLDDAIWQGRVKLSCEKVSDVDGWRIRKLEEIP
jgi:hypothetical protein